MKQSTKIKLIIFILTFSLFILWYYVYRRLLLEINEISYKSSFINSFFQKKKIFQPISHANVKLPNMKYILMWTHSKNVPFVYLDEGQKRFLKNHCPHVNCYVTSDRYYLEDYTQFDAILFAGPDLVTDDVDLPVRRSAQQKYIFASIESSHTYAICTKRFDTFFNWTWTYRLDSECRWGYIAIRNKKNTIIGPHKVMHWMKSDDMKPVSQNIKNILSSKTKAAAWFVSNCRSDNGREMFVQNLKLELEVYGLSVDTYGQCGNLICPREDQAKCDEMIKRTYYFYLAFENSFSPDYVTEKVLHGLRNYAVPVVYGGANYTRFMPEGAYLDARKLGPKRLADKMNELIKNPNKYAEYFKWTNHYTYHMRNESVQTNDYCSMCKLLNNEKMVKSKSVYKNFKDWWNPPNTC